MLCGHLPNTSKNLIILFIWNSEDTAEDTALELRTRFFEDTAGGDKPWDQDQSIYQSIIPFLGTEKLTERTGTHAVPLPSLGWRSEKQRRFSLRCCDSIRETQSEGATPGAKSGGGVLPRAPALRARGGATVNRPGPTVRGAH